MQFWDKADYRYRRELVATPLNEVERGNLPWGGLGLYTALYVNGLAENDYNQTLQAGTWMVAIGLAIAMNYKNLTVDSNPIYYWPTIVKDALDAVRSEYPELQAAIQSCPLYRLDRVSRDNALTYVLASMEWAPFDQITEEEYANGIARGLIHPRQSVGEP